jgi:hypothetical protein
VDCKRKIQLAKLARLYLQQTIGDVGCVTIHNIYEKEDDVKSSQAINVRYYFLLECAHDVRNVRLAVEYLN